MVTILCIGGSTYNEGTPNIIDKALHQTKFLEENIVIFVNHLYIPLHETNLHSISEKISKDFPNCSQSVEVISEFRSYNLMPGYIYVLPDCHGYDNENKERRYIQIIQEGNQIKAEVNNNSQSEAAKKEQENIIKLQNESSGDYYPNINQIMLDIAKLKNVNKAGLLLAGLGKDGSEGLIEIAKSGGKIAVQNPQDCKNEKRPKTDEMPSSAIQQAKEEKIDIELLTFSNLPNLEQWLRKLG